MGTELTGILTRLQSDIQRDYPAWHVSLEEFGAKASATDHVRLELSCNDSHVDQMAYAYTPGAKMSMDITITIIWEVQDSATNDPIHSRDVANTLAAWISATQLVDTNAGGIRVTRQRIFDPRDSDGRDTAARRFQVSFTTFIYVGLEIDTMQPDPAHVPLPTIPTNGDIDADIVKHFDSMVVTEAER